jgi:polysaccharide deacetylase family sporulation protein PdaB
LEKGADPLTHPDVIKRIQTDEKVVAFTFDDGPHPEYTAELIQLFGQYGGKATFFVLAPHAEQYPDLTRQLFEEGHEIGNHTVHHLPLADLSEKEMRDEIGTADEMLQRMIGRKPQLFRPPYGSYNETTLKVAREAGYKLVVWTDSQDTKDYSLPGAETIVKQVTDQLSGGDIVLMHDGSEEADCNREQTVEAIGTLLPLLQSQGYRFVTVSELLLLRA